MFFYSKPLVQCCAVEMGSIPGGAVFVTVAGRGPSVTFLATSASIFTAADTGSASRATAPATRAIKETTVKKVRDTNQIFLYFKKIFECSHLMSLKKQRLRIHTQILH